MSQSPLEATIARYKTSGGNNNSNEIIDVFAPYGGCFFENNGRRVLNKCNVPLRRGENGLLYPLSKDNPYYLSKFPLNLNGCFIYSSTTHFHKNMCPMKENIKVMNSFYYELNIHKPHKDHQNKKVGEVTSEDRQIGGLKNVCAPHNVQIHCITSCIFDIDTHLCGLYYMVNN